MWKKDNSTNFRKKNDDEHESTCIDVVDDNVDNDVFSTVFEGTFFNSLPNDKISDQSKLKAFADDKLKVIQMVKSVLDKIENIVGKEENAG